MPPDDVSVPIIAEVCAFIQKNLDGPLRLAELGRNAGMSAGHLQRVFKRIVGVSPRQYADACRLDRLKGRLKEGRTVTSALIQSGYGSSSRLYERSAEQLGMTPGEYREGATAVTIRFATAECELGRVLLAATDRGICAVFLADTDSELREALDAEFPEAEITRDASGLECWLTALVAHVAGEQPHLDLPLDVRATAFQRRVWEELRRIPYGETRSYSEVAAALGAPKSVRAVAGACATNPASLVIPCHRVVGRDGTLTGYRWGVQRKKKLLDREKGGG
jgi:AraC family transcriptional regulator of adaptative response/methylated-DNA-[protein]-cysteine methyltransferase